MRYLDYFKQLKPAACRDKLSEQNETTRAADLKGFRDLYEAAEQHPNDDKQRLTSALKYLLDLRYMPRRECDAVMAKLQSDVTSESRAIDMDEQGRRWRRP